MSHASAEQPGGQHPDAATLRIPNERARINDAELALMTAIDRHEFTKEARFAMRVAFEEAVSNAFRHGHRNLPPETTVLVEYRVTPDEVYIAVEDQGPGFNPQSVPDPTLDENLDAPSGRGLLLMRSFMSNISYNDRGNRVEMRFRRRGDDEATDGASPAS
jgi:serine/threonine-protein kinase RsbW